MKTGPRNNYYFFHSCTQNTANKEKSPQWDTQVDVTMHSKSGPRLLSWSLLVRIRYMTEMPFGSMDEGWIYFKIVYTLKHLKSQLYWVGDKVAYTAEYTFCILPRSWVPEGEVVFLFVWVQQFLDASIGAAEKNEVWEQVQCAADNIWERTIIAI